ncbi:MAG: hypothetical protein N2Z79_03775, partial [Candidatus Omnitrophica bacterium]|nr:hypothetical protein [Candidatus Omnitrophota bacterium]
LELISSLEFAQLSPLLKERFDLPLDLKGMANLTLVIHSEGAVNKISSIDGLLDIYSLDLNFVPKNLLFRDISGRIRFDREKITWNKVKFKFLEREYKSNGILYTHKIPRINFDLFSEDLSLEGNLKIENRIIRFTKLKGVYKDSKFSLIANVDTGDLDLLYSQAKINMELNLELLEEIFKNQTIKRINPQGKLHLSMELEGPLRRIKDCTIKAEALSPQLSLFGLRLDSISLDYFQSESRAYIRNLKGFFYEGNLLGEMKLDLDKDLNFNTQVSLSELRLEKLKLDTPFRQKNLSGKVSLNLNLSGQFKKIESLVGGGSLYIREANLWEINLFKGLG